MLSSPYRRFSWTRSERGGFSFFGLTAKRRRARTRLRKKQKGDGRTYKPAPWTPWLWIK